MKGLLDRALRDLSFAFRSLSRRRGYAALTVMTLALGIGASVAMFSVTNGVLLKPLPVQDQDRLVFITKHIKNDSLDIPFSLPDVIGLRALQPIFTGVAGVQYDGPLPYRFQSAGTGIDARALVASTGFFSLLGVAPAAGRFFPDSSDYSPSRLAVIGYGLWQRAFGGDAGVLGRQLRLGSENITIIGVAPAGFDFPRNTEVWITYERSPEDVDRSIVGAYSIVGRLQPGTALGTAQAAVRTFIARQESLNANELRGQIGFVEPLLDRVLGNVRAAVNALSGAVGLVLLISLANAAGLFLIQGSARARELAVRSALGAERRRLVSQIAVENAVLAVAAAIAGTLLAFAAVGVLVQGAPADIPRLREVAVDRGALAFALGATGIATLLFGLIPALWITRFTPFHSLRGSQRGATGSRANRRLQEALIVGQVAVAVVLFSGAGLLIRSLGKLRGVDLGLDSGGLSLVHVPRTTPTPAELPGTIAFYTQLSERLAAAPGIRAATPTTALPFAGPNAYSAFYALPGQTAAEAGRNPSIDLEAAAPNFFATLSIPILQGRPFSGEDRAGPPSVIVSATFAREAWRGRNPIGERFKFGSAGSPSIWYTVIGVAADTRYRNLTRDVPTVYLPLQRPDSLLGLSPSVLAVRSTLAPGAVLDLVRSIARELDPAVETLGVTTMPDALAAPLARPRFSTRLLTAFSLIAVLLTAIGLFGVMASFVQERTREIGIRIAVGAEARQIRRLVLGRGLRLTAIGMGIGLAGALGLTRLVGTLLYGVTPTDPATYVAVGIGMMAVTALACYWPVRRAARIDPMEVLTSD